MASPSALPRTLGLRVGSLFLVGAVIFAGPSPTARWVPEPLLVILICVFCGLLVLSGALALTRSSLYGLLILALGVLFDCVRKRPVPTPRPASAE